MKRIMLLLIAGCTMILHTVSAQTKIVTTGNNLVNPVDPYAADIVIGSDQGTRHDGSMMWWSSASACRISLLGDIFMLSSWASTVGNANIGLAAYNGGPSFFLGNVSIGTADSKGYKFAVNGSAIATSITVKAYVNWPDYVFKKDYRLRSLSEVQAYVEQNHHLPEIPSAQEIERNGLNLGEMNRLLMKKVEELTLYLIEKDKKEARQEEINKDQENKINKLQKQLDLFISLSRK